MGQDSTPLIGGEDLHLSPFHREKIVKGVNKKFYVAMGIFIALIIVMSGGLVGLVSAGIVLRDSTFFYIMAGPAVGIFLYIILLLVLAKAGQKRTIEAQKMFNENYIGSWVFERHNWSDFRAHVTNMAAKRLGISFAISFIVYAAFMVLFHVLMSKGRDFMSYWLPLCILQFILIAVFLIALLIIRYKGFSAVGSSCVLSRGGLYIMGDFYTLRPVTCQNMWDSQSFSVTNVTLSKKLVKNQLLNILSVRLASSGFPQTVEAQVPEVLLQNVIGWAVQFAEGYTHDVIINVDGHQPIVHPTVQLHPQAHVVNFVQPYGAVQQNQGQLQGHYIPSNKNDC